MRVRPYGRYGKGSYQPVHYLERHVPLHERMAFYSIADVAVVTATRDGMNLVPYEYIVCRQVRVAVRAHTCHDCTPDPEHAHTSDT
jgi:trehalose-6-phosphate synthase